MELIEFPHPNYNIAGRLDVDTTGLLILSTDGGLIHRIISPKKDVQKLYIAQVLRFSRDKIQLFHRGIKIDEDFTAKPVTHFEITEENDEFMYIKIGITEGKFHQVKKMFEAVGSTVIKLHRHSIGSLILDDSLEPGEYRELSAEELKVLFLNP
jgi:16S rRNA pseudouridine516 synthase